MGFFVTVFNWIQVLLQVCFILFVIRVVALNRTELSISSRKEKVFRFLDQQYHHLRTIAPDRIRSQEASYLYAALFL